ncbi:MAG: hypothetical protein ACK47B_23655 [Armatimonadota bacterium]
MSAVFDPAGPRLELEVPLPPPDNQCHRSGRFSRYATAAYRDWLDVAGEPLREALGGWQPDTERWWSVSLVLRLGSQGDGPNYLKPALDLLTGSRAARSGDRDQHGNKIDAGRIIKPGALWNDDRRVARVELVVTQVRQPEPRLLLIATAEERGPLDFRAWQEGQARRERERERQEAREERQRTKEAEKARKAAERAEKRAQRPAASRRSRTAGGQA